jgi:hypothetical protein
METYEQKFAMTYHRNVIYKTLSVNIEGHGVGSPVCVYQFFSALTGFYSEYFGFKFLLGLIFSYRCSALSLAIIVFSISFETQYIAITC